MLDPTQPLRSAANSDWARVGSLVAALVAGCVVLAGCGMVARQAVQTARGGVGDVLVIEPFRHLSPYDTVEFVPIENGVGANISESVLGEFNASVEKALIARGVYPPRGRILRFTGRIIHIETSGLHKEAIIRVELTDDATGEIVGIANVTGQAGGVSDLSDVANGLADGVVKLLRDNETP